MAKERLDVLLVKKNLIETREKAKRMIMAGLVFSNNERLDKPGMKVDEEIPLKVKGTIPYVSRGGFKLEKALSLFDTSVKNKMIVDIGSSTGGFTDCSLQNGAKLIYAVDVGYNQLAWKLRNDERVIVKERTNFRHATKEIFLEGLPNFCTIDVSFISLRLILPVLKDILQPGSEVITLIKPQFEAEKEQVGKKGIIRDKKIHQAVLTNIISFAQNEGFQFFNLTYSPITGGEGNIEFLAHLGWEVTNKDEKIDEQVVINEVVSEAHETLRKA
ncbi:TlyA family RNA methyltransferase [Pseudogracilibacillus auburnensis]|uniref:TlyA family RNA methyltransferase n=1 Tax=Pseudogracilibacillus auburnensis TaxID=1494959 RepID=UPI001A9682F1|nr:TlyA family RNA methyltransferase [Pseudogracilibacillus auburnensis]MBO1004305.1 TlyA family RNA methyltransferase [Pseudogracilibacillus auburnensis]